MSRQHDLRTAWLLQSRFSVNSRRQYIRNLHIENLESRLVLSGLPEVVAATPEPAAALPLAQIELDAQGTIPAMHSVTETPVPALGTAQPLGVAQPIAPADTLIDAQVVDSVFTQTGASTTGDVQATADTTLATSNLLLDAGGGGPAPPPGGGGTPGPGQPPLVPPSIVDFEGNNNANFWLFSGNVVDDKDTEGLTVCFGGLLNGLTAVVDQFGYFEIIVHLGSNSTGYVTAYTTDTDGLRSELVLFRVV